MATEPIEIVLQDAETPVDPTPTPESGEETSIVVPSTGTISNDGNSNGGIGSTISIILPIVIAVLALGAVVALLVRRQQKRKKVNNGTEECNTKVSKKEKFATAASGTIAILAATVLVGNLVIPATKAASDEFNSGNNSTTSEEGTYLETEDKITITATIDKDSEEDTYTVSTKDILYATTDASGYAVTMSMVQGAITSNLYLDGNTESEYYIAPVEETELTNNTWGYTLSEEAEGYSAIPLADTPATIKEGEEAVTHEEIDVYYTVKVNKELPLGTYSGTIEYNITPVNPIDKLTYMQDFASFSEEDKTKLLASMPEGEQYILKDKRDEKPYYISKLADGNVWMTQNLDFDIVKGGADINSTNTDVPAGWADGGNLANTYDDATWNGSYTAPESYDPGTLYWNGAFIYDKATCEANGGIWQYGSCLGAHAVSAISDNDHYLLGNYYNWNAAVVMSDSSSYETDGTDVGQSICPAGWMLPKSGATLTGSGSFIYLKNQANLTAGINGDIHIAPNWFTYGGSWYGSLGSDGTTSVYWSGVVMNSEQSYSLTFSSGGDINAQDYYSRDNGFSVRCVAR